jgi:hypothetical protein
LDDAVGGEVERLRQRRCLSFDTKGNRQARLSDAVDQLLEVAQARLWAERKPVLVRPEHAQKRSHLVDRHPAGLRYRSERVAMFGGELETRRRAEGGFSVRARLRLDATQA